MDDLAEHLAEVFGDVRVELHEMILRGKVFRLRKKPRPPVFRGQVYAKKCGACGKDMVLKRWRGQPRKWCSPSCAKRFKRANKKKDAAK